MNEFDDAFASDNPFDGDDMMAQPYANEELAGSSPASVNASDCVDHDIDMSLLAENHSVSPSGDFECSTSSSRADDADVEDLTRSPGASDDVEDLTRSPSDSAVDESTLDEFVERVVSDDRRSSTLDELLSFELATRATPKTRLQRTSSSTMSSSRVSFTAARVCLDEFNAAIRYVFPLERVAELWERFPFVDRLHGRQNVRVSVTTQVVDEAQKCVYEVIPFAHVKALNLELQGLSHPTHIDIVSDARPSFVYSIRGDTGSYTSASINAMVSYYNTAQVLGRLQSDIAWLRSVVQWPRGSSHTAYLHREAASEWSPGKMAAAVVCIMEVSALSTSFSFTARGVDPETSIELSNVAGYIARDPA